MISDHGLRFHAVLEKADGTRQTRETDNRHELLEWLTAHQCEGARVIEVGMTADESAARNMLAALRLGAAQLKTNAR